MPSPRFALPWSALHLLLLAGCGGSASPPNDTTDSRWWTQAGPGADLPADAEDAARFLTQATFGPTADGMTGLAFAGFEAWFERQRSLPPSLERPRLEALAAEGLDVTQLERVEVWWDHAVNAEDQLRQRMAFALSEILVVSDQMGRLRNEALGLAEYYDLLTRHALGNFRELIGEVTRSPVMGTYLSHLRNRKADPTTFRSPDENYARELMQLFTIGLVELHPDGSPVLDSNGDEVPSYEQRDVEELARVLTGWTFANSSTFLGGADDFIAPMESWDAHHDFDAKLLLGGQTIPAGLSPTDDLDAALDLLFAHPNVGPFLATRLIQRLVTSNPSPAYVQRVASVFGDDGAGVRGNLLAVATAILMDDEARRGHRDAPATFGKLREPLVRLAGLWRTFDAAAETGRYDYWNPQLELGQAPLRSPSVFNFFDPEFTAPGALRDAGLVAPEFQINTHQLTTSVANELARRVYEAYSGFAGADETTVTLDLTDELALADDPAALVEHLGLHLMGSAMDGEMKSMLVEHLTATPLATSNMPRGTQRVLDGIYLIITSPEGSVQR